MAATASLPATGSTGVSWRWLQNFLTQELKPYPGRSWTVARMTIAATLMMWWIMVYRIPGAALGAYYVLLFSRESAHATVQSALISVGAVACSLVFVLVGVAGLTGDPFLHFVWVSATLFVSFFLISALSEYRAGTGFGFLAVNSIAAWDFPANTETLVEGTLWSALAVITAAAVTVLVEVISQKIHPFDQFRESLQERIETVESVFRSWGTGVEPDEHTRSKLQQYALLGTALLRRNLLRSGRDPEIATELSALVALIGRLIDFSAYPSAGQTIFGTDERMRFLRAADYLHQVHLAVPHPKMRSMLRFTVPVEDASSHSLISDVEKTIARIPQIFAGLLSYDEFAPSPMDAPARTTLFKADAFSNPEHLRFALKGTLAAVTCYAIYNGIDWRLNTAVSTCLITALSTVGSSRQKQLLRVAGAIIGGFGFGMGSQVFILPHLNGIGGFTILFIAITLVSSWIATSSPRLSYAGVQIAFAFYVTHLSVFGPQTSLAVARNDVMGILFGLLVMWVLFDQIWVRDAATDVIESFADNMRAVARFDRHFSRDDLRTAVNRSRAERATISANFDRIRNDADALIFEFGSNWRQKVILRQEVRAWQPQLRTYFLQQLSLLHHRLQVRNRQLDIDTEQNIQESARILELLADRQDPRVKDKAQVSSRLDEVLAAPRHGPPNMAPEGPVFLSQSMLQAAHDLADDILAHST